MIDRRLLAAAALAVPALGFVRKAQAQIVAKSRLKAIQDSGHLRIGTTGDFNPMVFAPPALTATRAIRSTPATCWRPTWACRHSSSPPTGRR